MPEFRKNPVSELTALFFPPLACLSRISVNLSSPAPLSFSQLQTLYCSRSFHSLGLFQALYHTIRWLQQNDRALQGSFPCCSMQFRPSGLSRWIYCKQKGLLHTASRSRTAHLPCCTRLQHHLDLPLVFYHNNRSHLPAFRALPERYLYCK